MKLTSGTGVGTAKVECAPKAMAKAMYWTVSFMFERFRER